MRRKTSIPLLCIAMLPLALWAGSESSAVPSGEGGPSQAPAAAAPAPPAGEAAPAPVPAEEEQAEPVAPSGTAGLTVYKDPVTGRLMPVPATELRELLTEDMKRAASTSHEGLVETAAPGGGIMIDLQGRFQSMAWATVGADGTVTGHCHQGDLDTPATDPSEPRKE